MSTSRFSMLARSTAIALCLPGSAAFADLTNADVWSDWESYMTTAGYVVSATETTEGDTLTVSDLALDMALGEAEQDGNVRITIASIRFVQQRDGTVSIELPAEYGISFDVTSEDDEQVAVNLAFNQTDPVMSASGDPDAVTYEYAAASAGLQLSDLTLDGVAIEDDAINVDVTLTGLSYTTTSSLTGDLRALQQDMRVATLDYDFAFADPETDSALKLVGAMQGLVLDGSGALPLKADPQDVNAMLNAGFDLDGVFTTTGGNYDLSFSGPDGSGTANSTSEGSEITIVMNPVGLIYDVMQRNVDFTMLVTEFPLPLSISAAQIGANLQMPLQKGRDPQDFGFGISLSDFTMSDMIWGLFDPMSQLPRDPATLAIDLSGKARMLFDILDPAQAAVLEDTGAVPGELNALTLNTLELDVAGARLTGQGNFTFDNSDLVTFDGMPRPLGGLDLSLVGGNGLLDKLVGMGLVPEEQAMGARMMMGLFAVPGETPDTLKSRIEINPSGHVLANGQRIR